MLQLVQNLGSGKIFVTDVAPPSPNEKEVMVQNLYSVISSGTEGKTAKTAKKSLIGKAIEKPDQVKQVFETLKSQGPSNTYRAVKKKLDQYSPVGYSSCGVVLQVGKDIKNINVGDYVACAGVGYANHAEIISVPENLCVQISKDTDFRLLLITRLGQLQCSQSDRVI